MEFRIGRIPKLEEMIPLCMRVVSQSGKKEVVRKLIESMKIGDEISEKLLRNPTSGVSLSSNEGDALINLLISKRIIRTMTPTVRLIYEQIDLATKFLEGTKNLAEIREMLVKCIIENEGVVNIDEFGLCPSKAHKLFAALENTVFAGKIVASMATIQGSPAAVNICTCEPNKSGECAVVEEGQHGGSVTDLM